jgi:hypothetical protein
MFNLAVGYEALIRLTKQATMLLGVLRAASGSSSAPKKLARIGTELILGQLGGVLA